MNVYVSADVESARSLALELSARTHLVTSRWHSDEHFPNAESQAIAFFEDMTKSDVVLVFADFEASERYVELGMALAFNKRILLVGHTGVLFDHFPLVEVFSTQEEALDAIDAMEA